MGDTMGKANLYMKMAQVMAEISNMPKTGWNDHFKYHFVTADAVADKVRDLLSSRGVAFFASVVGKDLVDISRSYTDKRTGEIQTSSAKRWVIEFEFTFADSESGAYETRKWLAEADAADDKGINKCATAAEKYFLLKTFIVSSADEPDADADGARKRTQSAQNGNKPHQSPPTASAPNGVQNPAPKGTLSMTPTGGANGESAKQEFFPDEPPEGAVKVKLPPQIGTIDMQALGKRAFDEKLVHGRNHFADLMAKMLAEGWLRDAMNADAVLEAIRKREAEKALEAEGVQ